MSRVRNLVVAQSGGPTHVINSSLQGIIEAARDLAHMLKGTSGSYGFEELSAELRRIEEHLDRLLDGESPDSPAVWSEIEQALNRAGDHLCRRDTGAP